MALLPINYTQEFIINDCNDKQQANAYSSIFKRLWGKIIEVIK